MEWKTVVGSKQGNAYRGSVDGVCSALTSAKGMGGGMCPLLTDASIEETLSDNFMTQIRKSQGSVLPAELVGRKFRIRKLTPRECFRFMDVDEADIDVIEGSGVSRSAQYRLAGNSIVVSCLYEIFRKMFVERGCEDGRLF